MNFTRRLIARSRREDEGFTLIELMVVVLIIAILIAIAIPTFLGARARAQDRAAQSNLRNGLTAEKTVYTDTQEYDDTVATMEGVEASLDWGDELTVVVGDVETDDNGVVCLEQTSKSGKVFSIADVASGDDAGTYFGNDVACPAAPTPTNISTDLGASW